MHFPPNYGRAKSESNGPVLHTYKALYAPPKILTFVTIFTPETQIPFLGVPGS